MAKKRKKLILLAVSLITLVVLFMPQFNVGAQQANFGLQELENTGLPQADIRDTIANIIRIFLGFLGIIAVVLIIYGGYLIMTAAGKAEQVETGKKVLINSVIGLIIIIASYGIANFIISRFFEAAGGPKAPISPGGPGGYGGYLEGSPAYDVIESHYPARDAVNIPRNAKIIVTFKEPMDSATIIDNGKIFVNRILIYRSEEGESEAFTDVDAYTSDDRTFTFIPPVLGNTRFDTTYTVKLKGEIKNKKGENVFGSLGGYFWEFTVSTSVDNIPPQIVEVLPREGSKVSRNIVIQINFNEPVDPMTAVGIAKLRTDSAGEVDPLALADDSFSNIIVSYDDIGSIKYVPGIFTISNQYKTVEFKSINKCGVNSCGRDVFCLPGKRNFAIKVKAAPVSDQPPLAITQPYPPLGITDMSSNSLDGNRDGEATGPMGDNTVIPPVLSDNFVLRFSTLDDIDLVPPEIISHSPFRYETYVPLDQSVIVTFNKAMYKKSLNSANVKINSLEVLSIDINSYNYYHRPPLEGVNCVIYNEGDPNKAECYTSQVGILHDGLTKNTVYEPEFTSRIMDIYQNCFNPAKGGDGVAENVEIVSQKKRLDINVLRNAVEKYKNEFGDGLYYIQGAGYNSEGQGLMNHKYDDNITIIDKLAKLNILSVNDLSYPRGQYVYSVCSDGQSFSISTNILDATTAEIEHSQGKVQKVSEIENQDIATNAPIVYYGVCNSKIPFDIVNDYHINYAITNYNTIASLSLLHQKRDQDRKNDLNNLMQAIEGHKKETGSLPQPNLKVRIDDSGLRADIEDNIKIIPHDPVFGWNNKDYYYANFGDSFALLSILENTSDSDYKTITIPDGWQDAGIVYNYCIGDCASIQ